MKTWLISGSREFPDKGLAYAVFRQLFNPGDVVIHGGARGVDTWADEAAKARACKLDVWHAHWDRDGKQAGIIRNRQMLDLVRRTGLPYTLIQKGHER